MDRAELDYPCTFPIKVFLKPDAAGEEQIEVLVRAELEPGAALEVRRTLSRSGTYVCLTLSFTAIDAGQVLRIGKALRDAPGVLMSI